ncbi:MAG TPA: class I SAM-dependent methyltransferase [Thermoanaerobaculia bacterium]|nr:class I SAM-dependent methyltransferase [Thermoanaerobaculia bacterium]
MNLKNAAPEEFGPVKTFFYRLWAEPSIDPMHRRIAGEVPTDSGRLLDVGCGGGKLAHLIATSRPNVRVVGIDSSEPMIRVARKRYSSVANLEFRSGTVEQSGSSAEFDFALTVLSFHHWEEPENTLAAIHRALVPGGRLWVYEMDPDAPADAIRADRAPLWGFLRFPIGLQRRMARDHGFSMSEVESVVRPAVARTPFGDLRATRTGSMLRMEMGKDAIGAVSPLTPIPSSEGRGELAR